MKDLKLTSCTLMIAVYVVCRGELRDIREVFEEEEVVA